MDEWLEDKSIKSDTSEESAFAWDEGNTYL